METYALIVLALAAAGGLFLAVRHFQGANVPMPVSLIHGAAGVTGLVLLLLAWLQEGANVGTALVILVIAALGGLFLFSYHLRRRQAPKAVVVVHALVAVVGFVTLLLAVLG